ncbi:uncharacterized protein [Diadema setosum]|uniref:uncharacterized protein isoform X2 n=1 Tax=Diadema setosum TaxID=31175 RepID=UPI003B3B1BE6
MSEELHVSDVAVGPAPAKRPLDHASDIALDPDESALASKRIKISEGNNADDVSNVHVAISNGEVESATEEKSPTSNGKDRNDVKERCIQEDELEEPLPKYVMEAAANSNDEANGDDQDLSPVAKQDPQSTCESETNSEVSPDAASNVENTPNVESNSEGQQSTDQKSPPSLVCNSVIEENKEGEEQRDGPSEVSVSCAKEENVPASTPHEAKSHSDVDSDRTDNSGSCNGDGERRDVEHKGEPESTDVEHKGEPESTRENPKDHERLKSDVNGADSESEAMDVDVENDSDVRNTVQKLVVDAGSEPCNASETSVPKDSSGIDSKEVVDSDQTVEHVESMDTEDSAAGRRNDSVDKEGTSKVTDTADSTSESKENDADSFVDCLHKLSEEQQEARITVIKKLHEELRNEETKLLLLKKLRLNQQQPVSVPTKPEGVVSAAAVSAGAAAGGVAPPVNSHSHRAGLPPNMAHSSMSGSKPHASIQPQSNSAHRTDMPQLMRGSHIQRSLHNYQKGHSGPPPLIMAQQSSRSSSSSASSQSGQMVRAPVVRISTAAPAMSTSTHSVSRQMQHQQQHQQQSSRQSQMVNDGQSAASRQAAAKLALRKQLEKTLLQIPPPKPPPPELHFLPSAANNEFIILVGLEEVVNTILDMDKKDKNQSKGFIQPFKCGQCNTDFTTIWKQDPKQGIMCEACIVSNQKKALKAEHTNRLKTAFVKALQQEQEIEQRIQQSQSSQQPSVSRVSNSVQRHRPPTIVHRSHGSMHHSSSGQPKQRVLNPAPSQRVVQPIHYAYIPNLPVSAPQIQIIPKQHLMAAHRSSADRQREYLLDMIPSKGLGHPQNPVIWKR